MMPFSRLFFRFFCASTTLMLGTCVCLDVRLCVCVPVCVRTMLVFLWCRICCYVWLCAHAVCLPFTALKKARSMREQAKKPQRAQILLS